jgi:hypothetical protein
MRAEEPRRVFHVATADAVVIATNFVRRCIAWAHAHGLPRALARWEQEPSIENLRKLEDWRAYIRFQEHALEELAAGKLDAWFTECDDPPVDADGVTHGVRGG